MRADRLLSILLTVQSLGKTNAANLARQLEVSERTIYRDLDALSASGVPIVATPGPGGGIELLEGYRSDLTGLNSDEVSALLFAGVPISDLGFSPPTEQALLKLLAAMPRANQAKFQRLRERLLVDAEKWTPARETVPMLGVLQRSLETNQRLQMTHQKSDGSRSRRTVDPLGLVVKASVWYLIAGTPGGIRTFRASRITQAKMLEGSFVYPKDFVLKRYWQTWLEDFERRASVPKLWLTVRVKRKAKDALEFRLRDQPHAQVRWQTPERNHVMGELNVVAASFAWEILIEFLDSLEVIAPQTWRDRLEHIGHSFVHQYGSRRKLDP
jgi:predicted DNA-binding transcriptional regulator YafY